MRSEMFQRHGSQQLMRVRNFINPTLRGWIQYFKVGNSEAKHLDT